MNLAEFLTHTADRIPDHPAILFEGRSVSFAEMNQRVDALAHGLKRGGLRTGDVCVLMMPSSLDWALAYYALAKLGAVVVPVNFLYRRGELEHIFKDSGARAFIGHEDYLEEPLKVMDALPRMDMRISAGNDAPGGFVSLADLPVDEDGPFPIVPTDPDDPFAVIYTSGTTGLPKGAVLAHKGLMSDVVEVSRVRHTEPDDIVLSVLPLFHIYGQTHSLNISIYLGLTIHMWTGFDAETVMKAIEEEKSTILYAVPTMVNRLVELAADSPPARSGLRFVISGGASLPVEVLYRFEKAFNATIYESYGLTEFSPTCVENPFGRPTRPGSIGVPIPPFKVRVVDEDDTDVPVGDVGELIVSGSAVMKEYLNQPEATARALRGGWLHTGDLARMDEDGYIYIVDRKKDMIIRGGYNIYPREIEEVLYTHSGISEAAVMGIPHADLGEEIAAVIVLKPGVDVTEDQLRQYVRDRVAPYKYPRVIRFMDELPKTAAGNCRRRPRGKFSSEGSPWKNRSERNSTETFELGPLRET
ncbi:MAG: long-chain fatty acid--CoA ligase [Deltaproteobacteria bacterium]|nr:long-chain fatty acid--CoA ligase [Deltaproteobacteria bacterium]